MLYNFVCLCNIDFKKDIKKKYNYKKKINKLKNIL